MDNIEENGSLNNDKLLRALLKVRNIPDPDWNISPTEILFGRPMRDCLSFINRKPRYGNPNIRSVLKEAWAFSDRTLRVRISRTQEDLNKVFIKFNAISVGGGVILPLVKHSQFSKK